MEILLTGCGGRLGRALLQEWNGEHVVHGLGREELDLREPGALEGRLRGLSFDALVNCAALADVERCELDRREAKLVNAEAPGVLARACAERGARFVHFSTDYVLDGAEPARSKRLQLPPGGTSPASQSLRSNEAEGRGAGPD